jgi:hypothetical protein
MSTGHFLTLCPPLGVRGLPTRRLVCFNFAERYLKHSNANNCKENFLSIPKYRKILWFKQNAGKDIANGLGIARPK